MAAGWAAEYNPPVSSVGGRLNPSAFTDTHNAETGHPSQHPTEEH
jgi:hypothetical protein